MQDLGSIFSYGANGSLLYYNDGSVNDFSETWGDVDFGYEWNRSFESGGFMDGTADDIAPYNTITNQGLVTFKGSAGGVAGGGFRLQIDTVGTGGGGAAGKKGAIIIPYGTQATKNDEAGSKWIAKFDKIAETNNVVRGAGKDIWKNEGISLGNGRVSKLVKYTSDPLVSIPPADLLSSDLFPINEVAVNNALLDDNVLVFFWEVTGVKEMITLDLLFGDFELNSGYKNLLHHFPYIAVLNDVSPLDLGILSQDANIIQFDGDSLSDSTFVGSMFVSVSDPINVPEPSLIWMFIIGGIGLFFTRKNVAV